MTANKLLPLTRYLIRNQKCNSSLLGIINWSEQYGTLPDRYGFWKDYIHTNEINKIRNTLIQRTSYKLEDFHVVDPYAIINTSTILLKDNYLQECKRYNGQNVALWTVFSPITILSWILEEEPQLLCIPLIIWIVWAGKIKYNRMQYDKNYNDELAVLNDISNSIASDKYPWFKNNADLITRQNQLATAYYQEYQWNQRNQRNQRMSSSSSS
ncbi:MAG: hypothetical protein Homavirus12_5 [Homavirus sp.]|uniref:Uncharacterized protein n=1 Tax=Homavirus sp. TaxID=2487769 RepID=A0A3G5A7G5_9VIRU|nr:MAG: hypothetical protein Homavirus12_5 [Homavirus sp.]